MNSQIYIFDASKVSLIRSNKVHYKKAHQSYYSLNVQIIRAKWSCIIYKSLLDSDKELWIHLEAAILYNHYMGLTVKIAITTTKELKCWITYSHTYDNTKWQQFQNRFFKMRGGTLKPNMTLILIDLIAAIFMTLCHESGFPTLAVPWLNWWYLPNSIVLIYCTKYTY